MRLADAMRAAGAIDVLDHDGTHVAEGARSALAIVQDGTLVTRREGVLAVSMAQLLAVARALFAAFAAHVDAYVAERARRR